MKRRLLVLLTLAVLFFTACGSSNYAALEPAAAPPPASVPASMPDAAPVHISSESEVASDYFRFPTLTPERAGDRRLVYTVNMHLQSSNFLPDMRLLLDTIAEADGYLVSANIRGHDIRDTRLRDRRAEFRFRLPTEQLPAFIYFIENQYNIFALQQNMQEQTASYQSTQWLLDDLALERRLLVDSLDDNPTAEAEIAIEAQIREIDREIRRLEAGQNNIMQNVLYSTIDVTLSEAFPPNVILSPIAWFLIFTGFLVLLVCTPIFLYQRHKKKSA